ncbi:hypothetical protein TBLA_0E04560 [Henningerozyma blattae CBS 6284]|uniref:RING-type domain-containing protein n=1 Tax=Henningerozyma blattae (strain ATCC 34711 / CBS 6284 / DSM 70876 / NBRC 10599 / NRRL Y-10934 / UCD 77-7) TaxID=1071380 RepID=I2H556_HENB6|nr:hypothetical protein TBLA_0E04560 [Tetrapisispora blattae CBS 6284]CCH61508.1 hypothetical protein TBLA_0E04560 [Tetrapisispora blattae CBS 6284]
MENSEKNMDGGEDSKKGPIPSKNNKRQGLSKSKNKFSDNKKTTNQIGNSKNNNNRHQKKENSGNGSYRNKNYQRSGSGQEFNLDNDDYDWDASIQQELEHGNFKLRGRKARVSIDHLLDFHLPEHDQVYTKHNKGSGRGTRSRRNKFENDEHIHLHGDSYVNATYKLLVDGSYDYSEQKLDPNIPIPQEKIVRVVIPKGQNCPICLTDEPVAPHMVTCGHIFCLSCLITFFAQEEVIKNKDTGYVKPKKYKDCPLCGSIIRQKNIKAAIFQKDSDYANGTDTVMLPGKEVTFELVCRPHGSMLPLPVKLGLDPVKVGDFPPVNFEQLIPYARIMKCNRSYSLQLLQDDLEAIQNQLDIDKALYNDNGKAANAAIEDINERIMLILTEEESSPESQLSTSHIEKKLQTLNLDGTTNLKDTYDEASAYFFFQTSFQSSIKFFLSPLDVKILLAAFNSYSKCPNILKVKIENIHYGTVATEKLIYRYKYISHLPLGTEIAYVDIDWRNNEILPKEVYKQFANELKQRHRQFTIKMQREDNEKKKYQTKLEQEQAEFYKRENSSMPLFDETASRSSLNTSDIILDSLLSQGPRKSSTSTSKSTKASSTPIRSRKENTIWGTSISVVQNEKQYQEEKEFEDMLLKRIQGTNQTVPLNTDMDSLESTASKDSNQPLQAGKKGKKKKEKIILFSNGQRTF